MENRKRFSTYAAFFLKAILAASVIMFVCMALGELLYDKNLFSGFLSRPSLWGAVFLETAIATIFMTMIGSLILFHFRFFERKVFAGISAGVWSGLGAALIVVYAHFYWTREWHITAIAPGLIFGWILPGVLFITYLVYSSLALRESKPNVVVN
ncbi:MAG: hypothetical protein EOP06_04240 [Proteobacteria bacterium]|nr:MAG: hypothetical protein EOP06_04240 [Pseudomonadota bacterium]